MKLLLQNIACVLPLAATLVGCETQAGAALDVSFAPGSIDHLEFFFAKASADPSNKINPIPQLEPVGQLTIFPSVLLRDYAANDSVIVTANDSSYVYFVPSSATPKGDQLIVVGYLAGRPVSFDRETIVISSSRVNEYALTLHSPGADGGLADFGREPYQCIAVKTGNAADAVTRADDIDCDGNKTKDELTCDREVWDHTAPAVEACDGLDSGGDCLRAPSQVAGLCAEYVAAQAYCRLGGSYACDDSSPAVAIPSCDGAAPTSADPTNARAPICLNPTLCGGLTSSVLTVADLVPTLVCKVQFQPGEVESCSKFIMLAPTYPDGCPAADYLKSPDLDLRIDAKPQGMNCEYTGRVLRRTVGPLTNLVAVTLPVGNVPPTPLSVRRLTTVRLEYEETLSCTSEIFCRAVNGSMKLGASCL